MKKIIKWFFLGLGILLLLLISIGALFLNLSPQFGGKASPEQLEAYTKTGHFKDGIFLNEEEILMEINFHSISQMFKEMLQPDPNVSPKEDIQPQRISPGSLIDKADSLVRITWFGHSSFLIEMEGKNILLDPVFGLYAAPHPLLGRIRFNTEMPINIEELPEIDAVIISHDHYDHLDYPSIDKLKSKTRQFFAPLGVGNHLRAWGIADNQIKEMDWWQEESWENLKIVFTPSRHMSGRALSDQSATLWGSWVIQGPSKSLFFSGDSGYGKHFKEIGEKYGPFDLGLMECGQYNKLWAGVHMMPEETVTASIEVGAKWIVPIHWGAFSLATHSWIDPVERITKRARELNVPISTPRIGEPIILTDSIFPQTEWWKVIQ